MTIIKRSVDMLLSSIEALMQVLDGRVVEQQLIVGIGELGVIELAWRWRLRLRRRKQMRRWGS